MFDSLSSRIQDVFKSLRGEVRLTPEHVETALREIRLALLEADVNFKVVKAFIDRVRDRAMGQDVLRSLSPSQQVIRIVRDEMLALFGDTTGGLPPATQSPRVILLLGLQGSGKTTTAAKLGQWLSKQGRHPLLVSTELGCRVASLQDLACMKLSAISQRGDRKDFIDLYVLGDEMDLPGMLDLYREKFEVRDIGHVLHSLTYFDEADATEMPAMLRAIAWEDVKADLRRRVREFVRG